MYDRSRRSQEYEIDNVLMLLSDTTFMALLSRSNLFGLCDLDLMLSLLEIHSTSVYVTLSSNTPTSIVSQEEFKINVFISEHTLRTAPHKLCGRSQSIHPSLDVNSIYDTA